jgi:hypothetical protein
VELWKAARPLFQKSSQAKDVARIDRKLADAVDSHVMEENDSQLQRLEELKAHIEADEEPQCLVQTERAHII